MSNAKIIDKIQKCLRLSKSSNTHEAAAALRQAQKMMSAHGISENDLELAGYSDAEVDVPIQKNRKAPLVLVTLVGLIRKAFGVRAVLEDRIGISDVSYRVRYFGPSTRVQMAAYAHQVVYRAMEGAWRQHLKDNPIARGQRGWRTSFQSGWLLSVEEKLEDIGFPKDELEATEMMMDNHYRRSLSKAAINNQGVYSSIMDKGAAAAKDFSIARPMGAEQAALEKL